MIEPECRGGYTREQIMEIVGDRVDDFWHWMRGQTMMICNQDPQRKWVDDSEAPGGMRIVDIGPSLCDQPHGVVVYPWDLQRYLDGRPIID